MLPLVLPAFDAAEIPLFGSLSLKPFGMMVVLGILSGYFFLLARAKQKGLDSNEVFSLAFTCTAVGLVTAHLGEVLFYRPERIIRSPLELFTFWSSMSSFGGFFGAYAASLWCAWRKGRNWRLYADLLLQGLVVGWIFGRLGCTLLFDHPGLPSTFWLAMEYDGGPRHNLGFYEFLYTLLVMVPASLLLHRFWPKAPLGSQTAMIVLLYVPVRFGLDFLRATDLRHAGLTAAQWGCLAFFMLALGFAYRVRKTGRPNEELNPATHA